MPNTAASQTRPPLFPIEGALWANNNISVWVDHADTARSVAETLVKHGYELISADEIDHGVYKFQYFDKDGQNYGRAEGMNEFVALLLRTLSFDELMHEVAYRDGDKPWQVFKPTSGVATTLYRAENLELLASYCRAAYPDATVVTRPTLYPQW